MKCECKAEHGNKMTVTVTDVHQQGYKDQFLSSVLHALQYECLCITGLSSALFNIIIVLQTTVFRSFSTVYVTSQRVCFGKAFKEAGKS
jgi:hypothetical protein